MSCKIGCKVEAQGVEEGEGKASVRREVVVDVKGIEMGKSCAP